MTISKLHSNGKNEEYLTLLYVEIQDAIIADKEVGRQSWTSIFTKASWRRRLLLGCAIQAFGQLSGINGERLPYFFINPLAVG
jgi:antirestriction protein ArdC